MIVCGSSRCFPLFQPSGPLSLQCRILVNDESTRSSQSSLKASSLASSIVVPAPASVLPSTPSASIPTTSAPASEAAQTAPPSLLGDEIDEVDDYVLLSDDDDAFSDAEAAQSGNRVVYYDSSDSDDE